mgnify:CR=1 FL=1
MLMALVWVGVVVCGLLGAYVYHMDRAHRRHMEDEAQRVVDAWVHTTRTMHGM